MNELIDVMHAPVCGRPLSVSHDRRALSDSMKGLPMELAPALNFRRFFHNAFLRGAGIAIGIVIVLAWDSVRSHSSLTDGLPTTWQGASTEFDKRIRARFPLGMPAGDFIRELSNEGFKPMWFVSGGYYGAVRSEGWVLCRVSARVYWGLGPDDTLAYVDGKYREEGCL